MRTDRVRDWGVFRLERADCLLALRQLPDNSVDSIVTDPPYGLSFMGKRWDYDVPSVEVWAECLRVLKPGGHLLAFAGTRTQHRMAVRIEDAGFEIRDMIAWVYGSGFPKSLDVSKAIDKAAGVEREFTPLGNAVKRMIPGADQNATGSWIKDNGREYQPGVSEPATDAARQWQGWGTALKPALEPITVARKPLVGTVAENVLAHGTGALNIDGCRVATDEALKLGKTGLASEKFFTKGEAPQVEKHQHDAGRWPANLIHDGSDEVLSAFPQAAGQQGPISTTAPSEKTSNVYGRMKREGEASANSENAGTVGFKMKPGMRRLDEGSAARFFYCAKASKADRGEGNNHPTVKPTDLMRYLCRLVTPAGGWVLDPYMGSGSTGKAAVLEGFRFIGIDKDDDGEGNPLGYLDLSERRIARAIFGSIAL